MVKHPFTPSPPDLQTTSAHMIGVFDKRHVLSHFIGNDAWWLFGFACLLDFFGLGCLRSHIPQPQFITFTIYISIQVVITRHAATPSIKNITVEVNRIEWTKKSSKPTSTLWPFCNGCS